MTQLIPLILLVGQSRQVVHPDLMHAISSDKQVETLRQPWDQSMLDQSIIHDLLLRAAESTSRACKPDRCGQSEVGLLDWVTTQRHSTEGEARHHRSKQFSFAFIARLEFAFFINP